MRQPTRKAALVGKREAYRIEVARHLQTALSSGDSLLLVDYLCSHSNLPGPRGNLELAWAFADEVGEVASARPDELWRLCNALTTVTAAEAPVNDPREFSPFCGTVALGALGSVVPGFWNEAIGRLRELAGDSRWRLREAVCMGLQRLLATEFQQTVAVLGQWVATGDPYKLRAAAAAMAEPVLLRDPTSGEAGLRLHRGILAEVEQMVERRSEAFRVLRQGLGYTVSVVVQASPEEGWLFLEQLAASGDRDVRWIVRQNLTKNRLASRFPEQVLALQRQLDVS
jgi:hypothetical protein